jgi:hypothetical protein
MRRRCRETFARHVIYAAAARSPAEEAAQGGPASAVACKFAFGRFCPSFKLRSHQGEMFLYVLKRRSRLQFATSPRETPKEFCIHQRSPFASAKQSRKVRRIQSETKALTSRHCIHKDQVVKARDRGLTGS